MTAADDGGNSANWGTSPESGLRADDTAGRYTVRSVARAMRLIELVAEGPREGRSLSDLARGLGTSKSTTLALARTLTGSGMLRVRDTRPGPKYTLGTAMIRLGDITRHQVPLGDICRPILVRLSDLTKMTARVAICDQGHPVFIERVDGPGSVRFYTPLGQREVPHSSAAGKAILATMTEAQVRAICAESGLQARTARTITEFDALLADLAGVRANGFAVDDEEDAEGIFCVGAAFFGHDGSCAGAVSVTGIKNDLPEWRVNELGRTVRRAADEVCEQAGGARYADWSSKAAIA